jgi:hypothetical protein
MHFFRVALLTFLLVVLAAPLAHGKASVRIVGGAASPITSTPWQVGVLWAGQPKTYQAQFCGGTIKDASTIITAAHCVDSYPASAVDVLAGTAILSNEDNQLNGGQRIRVTNIAVDPGFDGAGSHDVALLKLAAPLSLNASVQPLPLLTAAQSSVLDSPSDSLVTSGWGSTTGYGPAENDPPTNFPMALRSVTVPFVDDLACAPSYPFDLVAETMLCAGAENKDSCQGDSGGPLAYNIGGSWRLAGVVNSGLGCGAAGYPGIYAEVASTPITNFLTGVTPPSPPDPPDDPGAPDDEVADDEDLDDPTVRLVRKQCTRRTCSLLLAVDDDDPSSGVRTVRAAVRSKSKACSAKKGKKKVCNRKLKVRAGGGGLYTVTATKLKRGRHVFTVTATDNAGNSGDRRITIKSR